MIVNTLWRVQQGSVCLAPEQRWHTSPGALPAPTWRRHPAHREAHSVERDLTSCLLQVQIHVFRKGHSPQSLCSAPARGTLPGRLSAPPRDPLAALHTSNQPQPWQRQPTTDNPMPRPCHPWVAALLLLAAMGGALAGLEGPAESDRGAWGGASAGAAVAGGLQRRLGETARRGLREIRRLWPKRSAAQLNITGTFRGEWTQMAWPQQLALGGAALQQGAGVTVLKLRHVGGGQVIDLVLCMVCPSAAGLYLLGVTLLGIAADLQDGRAICVHLLAVPLLCCPDVNMPRPFTYFFPADMP